MAVKFQKSMSILEQLIAKSRVCDYCKIDYDIKEDSYYINLKFNRFLKKKLDYFLSTSITQILSDIDKELMKGDTILFKFNDYDWNTFWDNYSLKAYEYFEATKCASKKTANKYLGGSRYNRINLESVYPIHSRLAKVYTEIANHGKGYGPGSLILLCEIFSNAIVYINANGPETTDYMVNNMIDWTTSLLENNNVNRNLIAIEGIDGCGKSTLLESLERIFITDECEKVTISSEPFEFIKYFKEDFTERTRLDVKSVTNIGTFLTKDIRKSFKNPSSDPNVIESLLAANRQCHMDALSKISESDREYFHISDRSIVSGLAYGNDIDYVAMINSMSMKNPRGNIPGCVIFVDVPVNTALARIGKRGEEKENYENAEKLSDVNERYQTILSFLADKMGVKFYIIDGKMSQKDVAIDAYEKIADYMNEVRG